MSVRVPEPDRTSPPLPEITPAKVPLALWEMLRVLLPSVIAVPPAPDRVPMVVVPVTLPERSSEPAFRVIALLEESVPFWDTASVPPLIVVPPE